MENQEKSIPLVDHFIERFTTEELYLAKSADLCAVAANLGYTVKKIGQYHTIKEMDSIRIYNRTNWFRWSRQYEKGSNGGSQIDFLMTFAGMDLKEAVFWLLDFVGYKSMNKNEHTYEVKKIVLQAPEPDKKMFMLPVPSNSNMYLYTYLHEERAISEEVIEYFVQKKLIYEERSHHNIVFKGNDREGNTRFSNMRGVFDRNGKSFKCDVAGNDKNYGFNVWNEDSGVLVVFEAAIDLMSYVDILKDYESNKLALGMLSDAPLATFLQEHPQIETIRFCIDNDVPGRKAAEKLMKKYYELGYEVEDCPPPKGFKDYNEWLTQTRVAERSSDGRRYRQK